VTSTSSSAVKKSGVPTALGSLVLAVLGPACVFLAAELCKRAGALTVIVTPVVILGVVSVFAFHVRFALTALDGRRHGGAALATLALVIGVVGFLAAVPSALGVFQ
jgi:hypothetical protein